MKKFEEIKRTIDEHKSFLKERFKLKSIGVFGSYLRGEQSEESDIDILVEFHSAIDLFEFIKLENFLSEILGSKVDLVMKDTLKPRIKDRILKEAVDI
jgi:predicted nucleotidyltransferase